ncbi:DMT family transporter [Geomicrobium sediminis]|uniref:Drug/metabolite transporter (DMT)-like permease n=1 Tax=Geomicrobium sediminis TaxID=1347788 RepID=A0ABS2P685_9BACL|nr:DMT family transporter [Geomicrobium sediminis]MBM7630919.1 drug/metabolite transporter (DMT)-like permease [Geomicrobium sediminis]
MNSSAKGWIYGFVGIIIFSGSLPATRVAVMELDPLFLTAIRAIIASLLAVAALLLFRSKLPRRTDLASLVIVAGGVVIGFPLLTALALEHNTAGQSIVFLGLLPLCTSIFAVIRGGERPNALFWFFSIIGSCIVSGYALLSNGDLSMLGNGYMLLAIIVCGLGYAEGAILSKRLGNWQVISWSLLISFPFMLVITLFLFPSSMMTMQVETYVSLFYVSFFSMYIGFVFWYQGLAIGGIASVGQIQLLQPFFGLVIAVVLLQETIGLFLVIVNVAVVLCVVLAKKYAN